MTEQHAQHGTFVIERLIEAAPAQVYAAFASAPAKARWFSAPQAEVLVREFDFRVGGAERLYCRWPPAAHRHQPSVRTTDFRARYLDIEPDRRIVYVYEMYLDERKISVSLATVEFRPHANGTRLVITEQGAFLNGYRDESAREAGTNGLLDQLVVSLPATDERVFSREITFTRLLFAPRALVFRAWTDPQHLARWFCPVGFTVSQCELDVRVGGRWCFTMHADDELADRVDRDHPVGGEYLEIEVPARLVFTNNALDAAGNIRVAGLTTVVLEELGDATKMTVRTRATGTGEDVAAMLQGMEQGWSECLLKLGGKVRELRDTARSGTPEG